jgi:hypothetical protein
LTNCAPLPSRLLLGVAATWLALGAAPAAGIADATGLCAVTDDPCVVFTTIPVDDGAVLDLGARTLELAGEGRLDVGAGTMTIAAGAVVLRTNARLVGEGGKIFVNTTGALRMEEASRVDASGPLGGLITLNAAGDATLAGILDAQSTGPADGGVVIVRGAAVGLAATARVLVGAAGAAGGSVALIATGALVVDAPLDASGGESGGAIECAGASVVLNGRVNLSGGPGGAGALIDIRASGPVTINGAIDGDARGGVLTGGGLGAEVSILAQSTVDLNGRIDLNGGAPGGEGGLIDILALGDVTQRGIIQARGAGSEGFGGEVRISTDGGVTLGDIDVGGGFAANRVLVSSKGVVRLTGLIGAQPTGGLGFGGVVEVTGCALDMDSTARVSTLGREGRTALAAGGQMILRGTLEAGQENVLTIRDAAVPPVILGDVTPAPTTVVVPDLPACAGPGPGQTTTTTIPFGECGDPLLAPYDALLCRLSAIRLTVEDASPASLGGRRVARSLRRRAARALRAVEIARSGRRVEKKLAAATRHLDRLLLRIQRGLDKGNLDATLATRLQTLGTQAIAQIQTLTPPQ